MERGVAEMHDPVRLPALLLTEYTNAVPWHPYLVAFIYTFIDVLLCMCDHVTVEMIDNWMTDNLVDNQLDKSI
jgi:hypothetical protein